MPLRSARVPVRVRAGAGPSSSASRRRPTPTRTGRMENWNSSSSRCSRRVRVSLVVPYSPEYRTLGPNLPLLTRLTEGTGGKVQNDAALIYRDAPSWVVGVRDIGPLLLLWSALLFLADVAIRRLLIRPSAVRESVTIGASAVGARVAGYRDASARPSAQPSTPQMNRLLERKTTSRTQAPEDDATTTQQLLNRRASRASEVGDEPFPYVASLPPKPKPPMPGGAAKPGEEGYTNRLLEAKRRAKDKDA